MSEVLAWFWLLGIGVIAVWFCVKRMNRAMWEAAAWGLGMVAVWGVTFAALLKVTA